MIKKKAPDEIPAPPIPVIALPIISPFEVGVDAQTMEPISKTATRANNTHLAE